MNVSFKFIQKITKKELINLKQERLSKTEPKTSDLTSLFNKKHKK